MPPHLQQEMLAVALVVAASLIGLSLTAKRDAGLVGGVGDALQGIFGVAAWIVPLTLCGGGGDVAHRPAAADRAAALGDAAGPAVHALRRRRADPSARNRQAGGRRGAPGRAATSATTSVRWSARWRATLGGTVILLALALVGADAGLPHLAGRDRPPVRARGARADPPVHRPGSRAAPGHHRAGPPIPAAARGKAPTAPAPTSAASSR